MPFRRTSCGLSECSLVRARRSPDAQAGVVVLIGRMGVKKASRA